MELQHVNVKLLVQRPEVVHLEAIVPVFHQWIQGQVSEELLLDVADYRHVVAGPGVVLIGHQANYSVDNTDNRLGVRYNRKAALEGSNHDRLKQAARAALVACQWLESDPGLNGMIRFNGRELEISINDRFLAPNLDATREAIEPELRAFLQKLFGGTEYAARYTTDPRRLFSVSVRTSNAFSVSDLLKNLPS